MGMARSIRIIGLERPLTVVPVDEDRFALIDGFLRLQALMVLNETNGLSDTVIHGSVFTSSVSIPTMALLRLSANKTNVNKGIVHDAQLVQMASREFTPEEIAEVTAIPFWYVNSLLRIARLNAFESEIKAGFLSPLLVLRVIRQTPDNVSAIRLIQDAINVARENKAKKVQLKHFQEVAATSLA